MLAYYLFSVSWLMTIFGYTPGQRRRLMHFHCRKQAGRYICIRDDTYGSLAWGACTLVGSLDRTCESSVRQDKALETQLKQTLYSIATM